MSFGTGIAPIAERIQGNHAVIACEPARASDALAEAIALRRKGVHFSLSVHAVDVRARLMREQSIALCATYATWDEVRLMLDAYGIEVAGRRNELPSADGRALAETIRLADSVIVRSWIEHGRVVEVAGSIRRTVDIVVNRDPAISATADGMQTDVLVYAPHARADELGAFITALADLAVPVTIVARDRPTIATPIAFVPPECATAALERARMIIDASEGDPGVALALAALGRPLAVASVGGASELLQGARSYDPWDRRSILTAAINGLSSEPPLICAGRWSDRPSMRARPVFDAHAPLVSIIVATYNRPQLLEHALSTIERQSYPSLEVIVVNDGGTPIADVVARFSRARAIECPDNRGPAAARNRGLAEASGTFAMFFDDDDEMFPDHVAALVHALDRSGFDVAYGQLMNCFATSDERGTLTLGRFAGQTSLLDHADIQWAGAIATTGVIFRRSLIEQIGALDETLELAEDYDFWLRLAHGREWARVADVTSLYFIHSDGANRSAANCGPRYLRAHQAIYRKAQATRPLVRAGRASMLEYFGATGPGS